MFSQASRKKEKKVLPAIITWKIIPREYNTALGWVSFEKRTEKAGEMIYYN